MKDDVQKDESETNGSGPTLVLLPSSLQSLNEVLASASREGSKEEVDKKVGREGSEETLPLCPTPVPCVSAESRAE